MMTHSPIILLIRPQMGENIGAVARAMSNFGLSELRIVSPRDGWPNKGAETMAAGALPIIQSAKIFDDVTSAMSDIHTAYATTARPRDLLKRVLSPEETVMEMLAMPFQKTALVFGPERSGLTNEDLALCDAIIIIPTSENASLNIAQAMVVVGYEWFKLSSREKTRDLIPSPKSLGLTRDDIVPAPKAEWDGMFSHLEGYLDQTTFFRIAEKKTGMWLNIQTMLMRAAWNDQEIRTFRGVIRSLWEKKPN